jgi:magnesium chelatase family protein
VLGVFTNARMESRELRRFASPDEEDRRLLRAAMEKLGLSGRAHDRILRVARTIADLDASDSVRAPHLAEAIQYRSLDRPRWWEGA